MARRRRYRRRAYTRRPTRSRRRGSSKKNLIPTKIPMSLGSVKYQWRRLALPSKAAVALIASGAILGQVAIQQAAQIPAVGRYAAMFAAIGAKLAKKA